MTCDEEASSAVLGSRGDISMRFPPHRGSAASISSYDTGPIMMSLPSMSCRPRLPEAVSTNLKRIFMPSSPRSLRASSAPPYISRKLELGFSESAPIGSASVTDISEGMLKKLSVSSSPLRSSCHCGRLSSGPVCTVWLPGLLPGKRYHCASAAVCSRHRARTIVTIFFIWCRFQL